LQTTAVTACQAGCSSSSGARTIQAAVSPSMRPHVLLLLVVLGSLCTRATPFSRPQSSASFRRGARQWATGREEDEVASPSSAVLPQVVDALNEKVVKAIKGGIDVFMADRDFARFYALETVARVPYFAYLSVLHLKETLGWWREPVLLKIHFAEAWNELHHLRIMEDLGGNDRYEDRFLAQHMAFAYYWTVVGLYLFAPSFAYNLNRHVEEHAFETYDRYLHEHEAWLKTQPVPAVARRYYETGDLYLFDSFQTNVERPTPRRPQLESLYDVFCAVRDDEREHALTMTAFEGDLGAALTAQEDLARELERVAEQTLMVSDGDEATLAEGIAITLSAERQAVEGSAVEGEVDVL
jgi:ubiquinol oxidase